MTVWILTTKAYYETEIISVHETEAGGVAAWEAKRRAMIDECKDSLLYWEQRGREEGKQHAWAVEHLKTEITGLEQATLSYADSDNYPMLRKYEVKP